MRRVPSSNMPHIEDPLTKALLPPPNESPSDRETRIQAQSEALRVSKEIDESLLESKKVLDNRKKAIKILLLGQAESGKSTTLKNFQLSFCPDQFGKTRAAWKMIVQLNLIRSVRQILLVLQEEWEESSKKQHSASRPGVRDSASTSTLLTDDHRRMRMRLSPLISVEEVLTRKLFPTSPNPQDSEISVRGGSGWIGYLSKVMSTSRPRSTGVNESNDATTILSACREDIVALWRDDIVRQLLEKHEKRIREMSGFFLDDAERIAVPNYEPTDQDIMRARIKTIGVEEHRFAVENGPFLKSDWYIYDVNGSRGVVAFTMGVLFRRRPFYYIPSTAYLQSVVGGGPPR